jgi:hypothetical protein
VSPFTGLQLSLWLRLLELPGIEEGQNSWGEGPALWINAKQVANFTRDGTIELRLTRRVISGRQAELRADARAILRGSSDWLGFHFESEADIEPVLELARLLPPLYLPEDGTAPKPPPMGAAMERRKRFH